MGNGVAYLSVIGCLVASGDAVLADQVIELGDMKFPQHDPRTPSKVFSFDIGFGPGGDPVVGFTIDFDYDFHDHDSSWASDLEMKVSTPSGATWIVGQSKFNGGDPFGPQDDIWDFDGIKSDPPGHYTSDHFPWTGAPEDLEGTWNFMFADTWDGLVMFNNTSITLHQIPQPAVPALFGVAALLDCRRRRRKAHAVSDPNQVGPSLGESPPTPD